MKSLIWLNRLAAVALISGFVALLHDRLDSSKELAEVRYAIEQSKKGERFTANDGRALCMAILSSHPEAEPILPDVCRRK